MNKRSILLILLAFALNLNSQSQTRPQGTVLLGGSLAAYQIDSNWWSFEGSVTAGWFPLNNAAIGTDLIYWTALGKEINLDPNITAYLFTRYHLPFFNPIFAQIAIGGSLPRSGNEMYWYSRLGYDFDIGKMVTLEFSISRYKGFQTAPAQFLSNLGFYILLNRNKDRKAANQVNGTDL